MPGCDFKHGPLYPLEPRRDVKLNPPPGGAYEKHFVVFTQKFPSFSHFMVHVGQQALFHPLLLR